MVIVFVPEAVYWTVPPVAWSAFEDTTSQVEVSWLLLTALLGFMVFWGLSFLFDLVVGRAVSRRKLAPIKPTASEFIVLLLLNIALVALLQSVSYHYGLGRQGQFNEEALPFKLAGMVMYTKAAVIPALLLMQIYWAESNGRWWLARAGVATLFAIGLVQMFMQDSRGAPLMPVLLLVLLWWQAGFRLRFVDKVAMVIFVGVTLIGIQMVTSMRLYGESASYFTWYQIVAGVNFVLLRITGVEQLMAIQYLGAPIPLNEVWDVLVSPGGIPAYYTTNLLGVDEKLPQTFAPSGIGWFYLAGGVPGVMIGAATIGFLVTFAWRALDGLFEGFSPVIKAFYLFMMLMLVAEGSMKEPLISFLISALVLKAYAFLRVLFGANGHKFTRTSGASL